MKYSLKDFDLKKILKVGEELTEELLKALTEELEARLPANVSQNETSYLIEILAPSIKKENISITIDKDILTVEVKDEGLKYKKDIEEHKKFIQKEWIKSSKGKAEFTITGEYDVEDITSELKDGILSIIIPVKTIEPEKAKTITIK
jgi:HSP20 family protein